MRRRLMTMLALMTALVGLRAQTDDVGRQILVFRNTGEVNLFYSNELDSITMNDTAQVFHAVDTTLIVPFAELDSVAVGSRNVMKFHADVKELTQSEDIPWIIRFDGQSIFYRLETPKHILPSLGQKLFYGIEEELSEETIFPYGLSVKVTNVTQQAEYIRVDVEIVPLNDIFERLFLAGPIRSSEPITASNKQNIHRAPVHFRIDLGHNIEMEDVGSIGIHGSLEIDGDAVISLNPFHNYSHADLTLTYGFCTNVTLEASENGSINYEKLSRDVRIATFYRLLNLDAAVGAFADFSAEMNLGVDLQRTYKRRLLWSRQGDESTFEFKEVNSGEPYEDEAKIDLTLKGELFFGPMLKIDFATIGDLVGARAKVKVGPKIEGEISLGMIQNMRDYRPEYYGNAKLDVCSQAAVEGSIIHRHNLVWGEVDEHNIFNRAFPFGRHEWFLFPQYEQSRAVAHVDTQKKTEVTVATAVPFHTLTPLETGFELVNPEGEVVDSVFVGVIAYQQEIEFGEQFFDSVLVVPNNLKYEELDSFTVRPIFHYAGYTVSAEPYNIIKDTNMQQYTSYQSNGAMAFISSGPFLNIVSQDSTIYTLGSYLPVPPKKRLTDKPFIPIEVGKNITAEKGETLVGTWVEEMDGEQLTLIFEEDGIGSLTPKGKASRPFDYGLNAPQTGEILIRFEDGSDLILHVQSLDDTTLKVIDKRDASRTTIIFQRQ